MKKYLISLLLIFYGFFGSATDSLQVQVLTFNEYLGYVKQFHPVVRQAGLQVNMAQYELLSSRGAFDPKIEVDYERKMFESTEYYDVLNSTFKIPTWFGIELKAGFEQNEGAYLNPQNRVPENGLYSAGIRVPVGQGLFINERMAALKQARIFLSLTESERKLIVNQILYEASLAYFNWYAAYNELKIFSEFVENTSIRYNGIKRQVLQGDKAAIDSIEAGIALNNRKLSLEKARIHYINKTLELSNFLWMEGNIPVDLREQIVPDAALPVNIDETLNTNSGLLADNALSEHPKLKVLEYKIQLLTIDKRLKADKLKPRLDVSYDLISEEVSPVGNFNTGDYKTGINFSLPLFLRKERGDLKLAKLKIRDAELDLSLELVRLKNKIEAIFKQLDSYKDQLSLVNVIVEDYATMLQGENRKFDLGESSIFLVNTRENSLIEARLKELDIQIELLSGKATLFNILATQLE